MPIYLFIFVPQQIKILLEIRDNSLISKNYKEQEGAKYILGCKIQSKLIMIVLYLRNSNTIQINLNDVFRDSQHSKACV